VSGIGSCGSDSPEKVTRLLPFRVAIGRASFADVQSRMVEPMQRKFRTGKRIAGVATFIAYVSNDQQASGAKSYLSLRLIDEELANLLPENEHFVIPDVGHEVWIEAAMTCREKTKPRLFSPQ
jgi:hypothetical protein